MSAERVRCAVCGKEVAGRVPPGGDGSTLIPWWHKAWNGQPCNGRFVEAELIAEDEG